MTKSMKIAMVGITIAFLLAVLPVVTATNAAAPTPVPQKSVAYQEFRVSHAGKFALADTLKKSIRKGRITLDQANAAFQLSTKLANGTVLTIAKLYRHNEDYDKMVDNLKTAADVGDSGNIKIQSDPIQLDCETEAFEFYGECVVAANDDPCSQMAFNFWCGCVGGTVLVWGEFCYIM